MVSDSSKIIYQEENNWFILYHKLSTKMKTEGLWFVWVEKRRWDMWPVASPRRRVQSSSCWWWQSFAFHGKCIGTATFAEPPNGHDAANLLPFCGREWIISRSRFLGAMPLPVKFTWECRRCSNLSDVCLIFCKTQTSHNIVGSRKEHKTKLRTHA